MRVVVATSAKRVESFGCARKRPAFDQATFAPAIRRGGRRAMPHQRQSADHGACPQRPVRAM